MTISQALSNYSNGTLVIDKYVYQYVTDTGLRVIYRFVFDANNLYLRKETLNGFSKTEENIEVTDADVLDVLPESIASFLSDTEYKYDIFDRDVDVPATDLFLVDFLEAHNLQEAVFKTY